MFWAKYLMAQVMDVDQIPELVDRFPLSVDRKNKPV
jgi:hypothetical protein